MHDDATSHRADGLRGTGIPAVPRFPRVYYLAFAMGFLALLVNGLLRAVLPPSPTTYAEVVDNKVVINRAFLENVRYPPIVEYLYWAIPGNGRFAKWALKLDVEGMVADARSRAGLGPSAPFWVDAEAGEKIEGEPGSLSSYENTYWLRHLRVLVKAIEEEGIQYFSIFGRFVCRDIIVEALRVQLRLVDLVRQHPEIAQEKIDRPIVIAGPPRTMTTHAQSILARHPETLYLRFLDTRDPMEPDGLDKSLVGTESDPRSKIMKIAQFIMHYMRPFFVYMFKVDADKPHDTAHEDIMLQAMVFGSSVYETQMYIPTYSKMWHDEDNTSAYRFLKLCQQVMQWQRAQRTGRDNMGTRWLMKTPEHAGFLPDLFNVYPDALVVLTHRDPVQVVQSFVPLVTYIMGLWNNRLDAPLFAEYNIVMLEKRLNHLVRSLDQLPSKQVLHIPFSRFVEDNMASIREICQFAGLNLTSTAVSRMQRYIDDSPREGATRLTYRIDTLGGSFSRPVLQKRFQTYSDKFREFMA